MLLLPAVPGDGSGEGPGTVPQHSPAPHPAGGDAGIAEGSGPPRRQLPADPGAGRRLPLLPRRVGSILPGVCYHAVSHCLTSPPCPSVPTAAPVSHRHPWKSSRKAQERGRKRRALSAGGQPPSCLLLPVPARPPPCSLPPSPHPRAPWYSLLWPGTALPPHPQANAMRYSLLWPGTAPPPPPRGQAALPPHCLPGAPALLTPLCPTRRSCIPSRPASGGRRSCCRAASRSCGTPRRWRGRR